MPMMRSTAAGDDDDTIGPNSRYMSVVNQSIAQQRRCQIVQDLDARMTRMKLQVLERNAIVQDQRYKRMQRRLQGSLERNLAYKLVVGEHKIIGADDYHSALNGKYTYDALKPEVQKMMERLKPSYIREQKAKMQLQRSKKAQEMIIERNLDHPSLQTAMQRERIERERQKRETAAAGGGNNPADDIYRLQKEHSGVIVAASGGYLLNRWASTFAGVKTPVINISGTDDQHTPAVPLVGTAQTTLEGSGKLFKKTGMLGKSQGASKQIHVYGSQRLHGRHTLKPITTQSLDAKSERSGRSEASTKSVLKTMSVNRTHRVNIVDTSGEEDNGEESGGGGIRKRRKRYTLPPVKIKKDLMATQNIY